MNDEILKRYADLWDDEGWCLLEAESMPGGLVPFHIRRSSMALIEDESQNQRVCERLRALGRPVLSEPPPLSAAGITPEMLGVTKRR